jgi:hypothetical protein
MIINSQTLSRANLDDIAADLGMQLVNARSNGVLLRPGYGETMDESFRVRGPGDRRVFAVTWSGHYAFMSAVFERDPCASIKSTLAHWRSAEDFYARAPMQQPDNHTSPMNWKDAR